MARIAAAALALGIIGLYGAISYAVALRTREIGIRLAVGLNPSRASRLMLREGAGIIAGGAAVGLLVFLAFAKLLGSLTFEVRPRDPYVLAFATAGVLAIAAVAMWIPALRASRINPAESLNSD